MSADQPIAPGSTGDARLPSFFVVGFPKTGSTTLHHRLVAAGAVPGTVKEPSVLLLDDRKARDVIAAYERYYPAAAAGPRIDATPYYVYDTRALDRIEQLGTATHAIVSVREPWSRIRSLYLDQFMQGFERRSLQHALHDELARPAGTIDRAGRDLSRRYIATSMYGPYIRRLLDSPLGERTRLVSAETLDEPTTLAALRAWTGLAISESTDRANPARRTTSSIPALVHGTASRVSSALPPRLHRRLAPVAKPAMARLASLPLPDRRTPVLDVAEETVARIDDQIARSCDLIRATGAESWAGPAPDWLNA